MVTSVRTTSEMQLARGRIVQEIVDSLPDGAVLLCHEKIGSFCHRHISTR